MRRPGTNNTKTVWQVRIRPQVKRISFVLAQLRNSVNLQVHFTLTQCTPACYHLTTDHSNAFTLGQVFIKIELRLSPSLCLLVSLFLPLFLLAIQLTGHDVFNTQKPSTPSTCAAPSFLVRVCILKSIALQTTFFSQ